MDDEQRAKVDEKMRMLGVYAESQATVKARRAWAHLCAFVAYVAFLTTGLGLLVYTLLLRLDSVLYGMAMLLLFGALVVAVGAFGEGKAK